MPTKRDALLDLIFTNKEGPVRSVKVKDNFACNDHEMVDFSILKAERKVKREITTPDFRRADFGESHFQFQSLLAILHPSCLFATFGLLPNTRAPIPICKLDIKIKVELVFSEGS